MLYLIFLKKKNTCNSMYYYTTSLIWTKRDVDIKNMYYFCFLFFLFWWVFVCFGWRGPSSCRVKLISSIYALVCCSNLSHMGSGSKKLRIPVSAKVNASMWLLMIPFIRKPFFRITFLCLENHSFSLAESSPSALQKAEYWQYKIK